MLDILGKILASAFIEYTGAFVKWSVMAVVNFVRGKEIFSLKRIYEGRRKAKGAERIADGAFNTFLGMVFMVCLILLMNKFGPTFKK